MQILATALPGFRDLRGPIIAGYLWLLFVALLTSPNIDKRPSGDLSGAIYNLGQEVGHIGVLVALSVLAYLIGSVSQELSNALRRSWTFLSGVARRLSGKIEMGWMTGDHVSRVRERGMVQLIKVFDSDVALRPEIRQKATDAVSAELAEQAKRAERNFERELSMPATLLVGEQPELFAEVDRLRAEGELRLTVTPPLVVLCVLAAQKASWLWLFALFGVFMLFVQGIRRDMQSRKLIADAVSMDKVPSPSVNDFAQWVDGGALTDAIDRATRKAMETVPS